MNESVNGMKGRRLGILSLAAAILAVGSVLLVGLGEPAYAQSCSPCFPGCNWLFSCCTGGGGGLTCACFNDPGFGYECDLCAGSCTQVVKKRSADTGAGGWYAGASSVCIA